MKKYILCVLLSVCIFSLGCGAEKAEKSAGSGQAKEMKEISLGLMPDIDSLPFIVAQEKGFFAEEGIQVNLQQFKSAMDRDSAMQSGNLDGAVSDLLAVAFAKEGGFDVKVTSFTDGSYKLVAGVGESAADVRDLQGKDVAVSKNTIIEYVADQILHRAQLDGDAVNKVIIPQIPVRLEMLQNGKLAAAVLPEPMAGIALHNGGHLISSSDQMGINPGVMMFTAKSVHEKTKEIQALYRAYNKAVAYLNETKPEEYLPMVLEKGGFPPAAKDSLQLPQYRKAGLPKASDINDCMAWLKEKNLIQKVYTDQDLVDNILEK